MVRRFALGFAVFLAHVCLVALLSVPGLHLAQSSLEPTSFFVFVSIWVSVVSLSCLLAFAMALRRIWHFPGQGAADSLEALHQRLLAVNALSCPVQVRQKGRMLIVAWRYDQIQWCELLGHLGIDQLYELRCRFDIPTHTVTLIDRRRTADFIICPEAIKIGTARLMFPLLGLRVHRLQTVAWYATAAPFDYAFKAKEIKGPVMGTILSAGWNVRYSLF